MNVSVIKWHKMHVFPEMHFRASDSPIAWRDLINQNRFTFTASMNDNFPTFVESIDHLLKLAEDVERVGWNPRPIYDMIDWQCANRKTDEFV